MTVAVESMYRPWPQEKSSGLGLEDKYEVMKEIGDGSFGSVTLARVRGAGAHIAKRGTLVSNLTSYVLLSMRITDASFFYRLLSRR